jgi:acetyl-CoA hydrolase
MRSSRNHHFSVVRAEEAAEWIAPDATMGCSGFTPAGAVKAFPRALAQRALRIREAGTPFGLRLITGASTGRSLDDALADAEAIAWRAPYQSSQSLRRRINHQQTQFLDLHLSHLPQLIEFGFLGAIDWAVVEATDVTVDGRIYLSTSIGISPTILRHAKKIVVELNRHHSTRLHEMHDIWTVPPPPARNPIAINHPLTKIGQPFVQVDPKKIVGLIETDEADEMDSFTASDTQCERIANHVVDFLLSEMKTGRIPRSFLPLQAGVGNISNAVMGRLGNDTRIPPFQMYTEVFQDTLVDLMLRERLLGASSAALTLSEPQIQKLYANMDFFVSRLVLRPQELSNHPGIIRRLGVIALNTALEIDIYGCANSTHVCGTQLVNGIGGSGDFVRNSYISILICPSTAKDGRISTIVPMVTHCDHNEHSLQVVATEQGLADLRGLGPMERARTIIAKCAHPSYRDYLNHYVETARMGHIRHDLSRCFELHQRYLNTGSMLP